MFASTNAHLTASLPDLILILALQSVSLHAKKVTKISNNFSLSSEALLRIYLTEMLYVGFVTQESQIQNASCGNPCLYDSKNRHVFLFQIHPSASLNHRPSKFEPTYYDLLQIDNFLYQPATISISQNCFFSLMSISWMFLLSKVFVYFLQKIQNLKKIYNMSFHSNR